MQKVANKSRGIKTGLKGKRKQPGWVIRKRKIEFDKKRQQMMNKVKGDNFVEMSNLGPNIETGGDGAFLEDLSLEYEQPFGDTAGQDVVAKNSEGGNEGGGYSDYDNSTDNQGYEEQRHREMLRSGEDESQASDKEDNFQENQETEQPDKLTSEQQKNVAGQLDKDKTTAKKENNEESGDVTDKETEKPTKYQSAENQPDRISTQEGQKRAEAVLKKEVRQKQKIQKKISELAKKSQEIAKKVQKTAKKIRILWSCLSALVAAAPYIFGGLVILLVIYILIYIAQNPIEAAQEIGLEDLWKLLNNIK